MIKNADSRLSRIAALALTFSSFVCAVCAAAFPQTARSKAEERFSSFGWAERTAEDEAASNGASGASRAPRRFELGRAASDGSSALSQDTHQFPAASLAALMSDKAAAPMLPGAGSLDFSSAPAALISLFSEIASSFKTRDYSAIKAAQSSEFIPIMLEYMTRRLPQVKDAAFAGVELALDGKSARATLRISFSSGDNVIEPVFATAEAVLEDGAWRAADVIFDGDSYGKAAKSSRM